MPRLVLPPEPIPAPLPPVPVAVLAPQKWSPVWRAVALAVAARPVAPPWWRSWSWSCLAASLM
ncbi:MAG TPA: hypothetical protein VK773_12300 [Acidimicrobiales bacterium]|nr:hypothetical protein [Acidimicrobiales bacterium]